MRVSIFTILFMFFSLYTFSQFRVGHTYFLMNDFTLARNEYVADISLSISKEDDTTYLADYYKIDGPLILEKTYYDKHLSVYHGKTCWYDKNGNLDSIAFFYKGKMQGAVEYYDDSLRLISGEYYKSGKLIYIDSLVIKDRMSLQNPIRLFKSFAQNSYIISSKVNADTINQPINKSVLIESSFRGGNENWTNYINWNLRLPYRLEYLLSKKGGGDRIVEVKFGIDTLGKTCDIVLLKSIEINADNEARKIIKFSPKWYPASENGRLVKSIYVQQFLFKVKVDDNIKLGLPNSGPFIIKGF